MKLSDSVEIKGEISMKTCLIILFAGILGFTAVAQNATFESLSKAEHIYGDKITAGDLNGKVVFLEYWGINCPPYKASIPHLVEIQKRLSYQEKSGVMS
jgi:thiol-disulfide isomerase/thioredoxin